MPQTRFSELCSILDTLLGPNGCPWDREQTFETLRKHLLEETCELIDAIHARDTEGMKEEIGDLFLNLVFFAKIASKDGHFTLEDTLTTINEKLIRRHPHIFAKGEVPESVEQFMTQWEQIKKAEKGHRESVMDSIPKSLPALERAYTMVSKMKKAGFTYTAETDAEDLLGEELFQLVERAHEQDIHAELALKKVCGQKERAFRKWEKRKKDEL